MVIQKDNLSMVNLVIKKNKVNLDFVKNVNLRRKKITSFINFPEGVWNNLSLARGVTTNW